MRSIRSAFAAVLCAAPVVCVAAGPQAADRMVVEPLVALARRAGLRVVEGDHLALATDRPVDAADGIDELPQVFDQAVAAWCGHYGLDPETVVGWRAFGCVVVDRERFRAAGLLPAEVPPFDHGFCDRNRFWMLDQSNPAYRRHLLLHEGVHAFTITVRGLTAPTWYAEGIAECLATHRLERGAQGEPRFVPTPIPAAASDVEQLGRIEQLHRQHAAGRAAGLAEVLATPPGAHREIADYAASWAAVVLFSRHPHYAAGFRALERGPLDAALTERLGKLPDWDEARAARDFDALTAEIDYGFDFARSAIDWSPGGRLKGPIRARVDGGRGWQSCGWSLVKGGRYALSATGRVVIGRAGDVVLESEPAGIALRWYRGRPAGRLLAGQWVDEPAGGGRPAFVVVAEGAGGSFTAAADGPLQFKLNESPGELADNAGGYDVDVSDR